MHFLCSLKEQKNIKRTILLLTVTTLLYFLFVQPLLQPSYSLQITIPGFVTDAINFVSDPAGFITDEIIQGICTSISSAVVSVANAIVDGMVESMAPSTDLFKEKIGETLYKSMIYGGQISGMTLATVIFFISLFLFFFKGITMNQQDNPLRLCLRYVASMFLCFNGESVLDVFLDITNTLWTEYTTKFSTDLQDAGSTLKFKYFMAGGFPSDDSYTILGAVVNNITGGAVLKPLIMIIILIITWKLLKGFLRLYVEMVERYIVLIILYIFFPMGAATITSAGSSNIFKSYLKMIAAESFLLFSGMMMIKIFIIMLVTGMFTESVFNYIFCMAFLRVIQRMDSYMSSMGICVAQTGAGLIDNIGGSIQSLLRTVSGVNRTGRQLGNAMAAAGAATGNVGLTTFGKSMERGVSGNAVQVLTGANIGNRKESLAAIGQGRSAGTVPGSANETEDALRNALGRPSDRDSQNVVKAFKNKNILEGANQMAKDTGIAIKRLDPNNIRNGTVPYEGKLGGEKGISVKGNISNKYSDGAMDLGNGLFMTARATGNTDNTIPPDRESINNALVANGMGAFKDKFSASAIDSADYLRFDKNGNAILSTGYGKDRKNIAKMDTNGTVKYSQTFAYDAAITRRMEAYNANNPANEADPYKDNFSGSRKDSHKDIIPANGKDSSKDNISVKSTNSSTANISVNGSSKDKSSASAINNADSVKIGKKGGELLTSSNGKDMKKMDSSGTAKYSQPFDLKKSGLAANTAFSVSDKKIAAPLSSSDERRLKDQLGISWLDPFKQQKNGTFSAHAEYADGSEGMITVSDNIGNGRISNYNISTFDGNGELSVVVSDINSTIPIRSNASDKKESPDLGNDSKKTDSGSEPDDDALPEDNTNNDDSQNPVPEDTPDNTNVPVNDDNFSYDHPADNADDDQNRT